LALKNADLPRSTARLTFVLNVFVNWLMIRLFAIAVYCEYVNSSCFDGVFKLGSSLVLKRYVFVVLVEARFQFLLSDRVK
jgi:hypothetical protein